jgi:predicted AlkP superfamily pyrophosphatase or phosphodiesterase
VGGTSAGVGNAGYTGGQFLARYADLSGRVEPPDDDAVTEMTLGLAREHTPTFIITQLGEPDTTFHRIGPTSLEAESVVRDTDRRLRQMVIALVGLGYGVILLADHSQHDVPADDPSEYRGWHDDLIVPEDALVPCTWASVMEDGS